MFMRHFCMRLDLIGNTRTQTSKKGETHINKFTEGTPVWMRSFSRVLSWIVGSGMSPMDKTMYKILKIWCIWARHIDQVRYKLEDGVNEIPPAPDVSAPTTSQPKCAVDLPRTEVTKTDLQVVQMTNTPLPPILSPHVSILDNSSQAASPAHSPQVMLLNSGTPYLRHSNSPKENLHF